MNQEETKLLYGRVGMIVALSQMIEYNLAEVQAYHKALNNLSGAELQSDRQKQILIEADKIYHTNLAKTLGQNIQGIKDSHIFKDAPELIDVLDEVLKERNYVIHQLFKDDVRKQCIQNNLQQVLDRLGDDVDRLNNLNEKLLEIIIDLDQKLSNSVK
jgi:hypothetical protein